MGLATILKGTRVQHTTYGMGVIVESDPDRTLIRFDTHGNMRFNTGFLNVVVVPAPPDSVG